MKTLFTLTLSILLFAGAASAVTRFEVAMDNGTKITVDNASDHSRAAVSELVLRADRSTQSDCTSKPCKGLFKTGDRICVTRGYVAWFDLSTDDGVDFGSDFQHTKWERSGELAGWWTLDAKTGTFKYPKKGPNGCPDWAHNELIPGSASPNKQQSWWDKYSPPIEHIIGVVGKSGRYFMGHHYSRQSPNSGWVLATDGVEDSAGVHYKTTGKMVSPTFKVDITDGDDTNGIANYIQSEMEYICGPDRVRCVWKFRAPNGAVVSDNMFTYIWTAYAMDETGTKCDVFPTGRRWPAKTYGKPLYNQSSLTLQPTFEPYEPVQPGKIVRMVLGEVCSNPYRNVDIYSTPTFAVRDGSWIRCGESRTLSKSKPRLQFTNIGVPNTGKGTYDNPARFAWDKLISWNETHDGSLGFGVGRGPFRNASNYITLRSGAWYQSEFALSTEF